MSDFERYGASDLDADFYKWAFPSEPAGDNAAANAIFNARQGARDSAGDEPFELQEKKRHRTMIWELVSDYCRADKYTPWHSGYYKGQTPEMLPLETPYDDGVGYGPPADDSRGRRVPPAAATFDKFRAMHALQFAPGLNFGPDQDPAAADDDQLLQAWDGMDDVLTDFGATRGQYELFTDFFVDICDGFRGAYINGDMREVLKNPVKESYVWVGELYELLYGLKNGWAWTAIQGTKEQQCATLGGYEFGRLIDTGSYFDYKGAPADFHPSDPDPNTPGARKGDTAPADDKNHRFGNWEDFGVVGKEYTGPLNDDETANTDEAFNGDGTYVTGTHHGTVAEKKYGYGAPGGGEVIWTKEISSNKRLWSKIDAGGGVIIEEETTSGFTKSSTAIGGTTSEEEMTGAKIWSKKVCGGYSVEETIQGGCCTTVISGSVVDINGGDITATHTGNLTETHIGNTVTTVVGAMSESFIGGQTSFSLSGAATLEVAARMDVFLGAALSIAIGPVVEIKALGSTEISMTTFKIGGAEVELAAGWKKVCAAAFLGI